MEAKELRIGNYLIHDGYFIKSYSVDGFINVIKNIDNYEPIPLTEEWLVKFGFNKLEGWDDMYYFQIGDFQIYEYNVSGYEFDDFGIKHVHQLQNLYFALTNEELTIK